MHCPNCGTSVETSVGFCPNCGTNLNRAAEDLPPVIGSLTTRLRSLHALQALLLKLPFRSLKKSSSASLLT